MSQGGLLRERLPDFPLESASAKGPLLGGSRSNVKLFKQKTAASAKVLFFSRSTVLSLVNLELALEAESDPISMGNIPVPVSPRACRLEEGLLVTGVGTHCSDGELCTQQRGVLCS